VFDGDAREVEDREGVLVDRQPEEATGGFLWLSIRRGVAAGGDEQEED